MKLKRILYVVNKELLVIDDPSFHMALNLHKNNNCLLEVLVVINDKELPGYGVFSSEKFNSIKKDIVDSQQYLLENQLKRYLKNNVSTKIRCGIEFIEIIRESAEGDCDLVIKYQDMRHTDLRSLDLHLMRKMEQPLWVMRHSTPSKDPYVVAAVDLGLEASEAGQAVNKKIIETAKLISGEIGAGLRVLSCWNVSGEEYFKNNPFFSVKGVDFSEILELEEARYNDLLKGFMRKYLLSEYMLIRGEPVKAICNYISVERPELLVMGTFSRLGIQGYLIGNTAEDILLTIDCSVLVVKPDEFSSPVL